MPSNHDLTKKVKTITKVSLKSLLSSIPYIGVPASGIWETYQDLRYQDFINNLSEQLNQLDEKKVDKDYIKSEEFYDLFLRALRIRCLHRSKIKARFILGLVVDSLRNDRDHEISASLKEAFLDLLERLTDEEMKLLYDFSNEKYVNITRKNFYEKAKGIEIDGLIAKGILAEDETWAKTIIKTELGKKFISYMRIIAKEGLELSRKI